MTALPSLWLLPRPLLLASKSQARRALIAAAGLPVEAVDAGINERAVAEPLRTAGAGSAAIAAALARGKALALSPHSPGRLVLGADQTLALGDAVLFKPGSRAAAGAQILSLAGRTHTLHSAFCLARDGEVLAEACEAAHLACRPFSAAFIDLYLDLVGADALTSVGGYAIEGLGVHLFERVEGEQSTILGLPMLPLLARLRAIGACPA